MTDKIENIVAYFDFDGTLTRHDTFIIFLAYAVGWAKFMAKLPFVIPTAVLYLLRIINNEEAKQRTLRILLKGYSYEFLDKKARDFAVNHLSYMIKPDIYNKVEYHLEHGHQVILVSANLAMYLNYWAKRHHFSGVIATEIEFQDNKCTGKLATRNCYGQQKILRIHEYLRQNNLHFDYSYGYGNSRGDYELLNYVDEGYYVYRYTIIPWKQ